MKSLRQIYVEYEIGEIYPENLPDEIIKILNPNTRNTHLIKISKMFKPTRRDIFDSLNQAFNIAEKNKMTKYEKLELLIDRFLNGKIEVETLLRRIDYFDLKFVIQTKSYGDFEQSLFTLSKVGWVPGDDWDWIIERIKNEFKFHNNYSDFLLHK